MGIITKPAKKYNFWHSKKTVVAIIIIITVTTGVIDALYPQSYPKGILLSSKVFQITSRN